jgi:hypothetical protein
MAYKRPASKAAGGARKKQRGTPVAKKCKVVGHAVRQEESLPQPVRKMISDRLVHVFGTYKEDRHSFQNTVSSLVSDTLKATQSKLQGAIDEAQAKKAACEAEGGTLGAANDAATAMSDAAAKANADAKSHASDCHTALKDAKTALHDLETAVKTAETDASSLTAKKEKLDSIIKEFFVPVKEGTLDKGLTKSAAWVGKHLSKEFESTLEKEFVACVVRTFSKPASSWGTFDHIIDKELDGKLKDIVAGLTSELATMEGAKEPRAANVEAAKGAVVAADEKVKAAEEAHTATAVAAKDAKAGSKASTTALKQQQHIIEKAASALQHAEHALTAFKEGALAAYTEVEAHTAPPPPPEPVEEPAAVEAAMAPAPAPAARAASTILPSPGVLSWVAQASGLSRSPQIAPSPRAA